MFSKINSGMSDSFVGASADSEGDMSFSLESHSALMQKPEC